MADLLTLLQNRGFVPRKISTNNGGEFCAPCPVCGDGGKGKESDRFHIWPWRENGGKCAGRYWCRQCGISGDTIAFLQKIDGLTFPQACAELGIPIDQPGPVHSSRYQAPPTAPRTPDTWSPKTYPEPGPIWQEKAANLLADCQERLQATPEALSWLAARGISAELARTYGLGYNLSSKGKDRYRPRAAWGLPEKQQGGKDKRLWIPRGWMIPACNRTDQLVQLRIRRLNEDIDTFAANIKYLPIDGSSMGTMVLYPEAEVFVPVECGFDAILLAGLTEGKIGIMTTWNSAARPDAYAHGLLAKASLILGGLDYDQGGDREQEWWQNQYRNYRRLPALPGGAGDPGEAAKDGVDLREWLIAGLPRGLQIKLGFVTSRRSRPEVPAPDKQPAPSNDVEKPETDQQPAEVIELELINGKVVYITNDPSQWQLLSSQGKPVFSQNELERLQIALAGLEVEARAEAIARAIDAKEIFGGYIQQGRQGSGMEGEGGK